MSGCCCIRNQEDYEARETYSYECHYYGGIYLGDYTWIDCSEYLCRCSLVEDCDTSWPLAEVVLIVGLALFLLMMLH